MVQWRLVYNKHFKFPVLIYDIFCRLAKEKQMYEKEVVDQGDKVEKMKAENKDEYDIKKQVYWVNVMLLEYRIPSFWYI